MRLSRRLALARSTQQKYNIASITHGVRESQHHAAPKSEPEPPNFNCAGETANFNVCGIRFSGTHHPRPIDRRPGNIYERGDRGFASSSRRIL